MHLIQQLRVGMDVAAPRHDVGLQVGDTIDDGHDKSWAGYVLSGLAQGSSFAQYSPRSTAMGGPDKVRGGRSVNAEKDRRRVRLYRRWRRHRRVHRGQPAVGKS